MCDVKSAKENFEDTIKSLKERSQNRKQLLTLLIVEYGDDELVSNILRSKKSQIAYEMIRHYGDKVSEANLKRLVIALWRDPGGPIYKWPLYACRDAKVILGDHFDSIVNRAINECRVELCACLILDCDLSDFQKERAVEMIVDNSGDNHTKWLGRLAGTKKLNFKQKELFSTLLEERKREEKTFSSEIPALAS